MRWDKTNRTFLFAYLGLLVTCLAVLIWFRGRIISDMNSSIKSTVGVFDPTVLRKPNDPAISFSQIERLRQTTLTNPFIRDVVVTKTIINSGQHPIVPFYFPVTKPEWQTELSNWKRYTIESFGIDYGAVFVLPDERFLIGVNSATIAFTLLLICSMILFIWRTMTQQRALTQTTLALEEKQAQLIRMERLALAGQLTANIFHDIKKPILNIKHAIQEANESLQNDAPANNNNDDKILNEVDDQISIFLSMLKDLNMERFVKALDSEQEWIDINDLLMRSLSLVKYEQGIVEIDLNLSDDLPAILGYPYRLIQVFSNLILNAYQAMREKGKLRLTTYADSNRESIIVEFSDSGPGVPDKLKTTIFSPFFTTHPEGEGSGLGLYIVRMICDSSNSKVEVEDDPGGGARFKVTLPINVR